MTGRFEAIGDDPGAVEAQAQRWRQLARRMAEVARAVDVQVAAVSAAWPEGGAAVLAVGEARLCGHDAGEAAQTYDRAASLLEGLVERLRRWRRQVTDLDEAWQVLSQVEEQARSAAQADLGDPHSAARIVLAQHQLALAVARTGHPSAAAVEAVYDRLRRQASGQVDDVACGLRRLAARGAAALPGTGVGIGGVSRFRSELALLAEGARAQGRLAPQVSRLVDDGVLPPEAAGWDADSLAAYVQAHPHRAAQLVARRPVTGADTSGRLGSRPVLVVGPSVQEAPSPMEPFETFLATLGAAPVPTLTSVGDPGWPRRLAVRAAFEAMTSPEQQVAALLWPAVIGNLSGAPFGVRATANHVRIVAAVGEQERRNAARARDAWTPGAVNEVGSTGSVYGWKELERDRAHLAQLRILAADVSRQVVWFDNSGDGSIVELHGALTAATVGVGVFVPGTGAELGGHATNVARSQSWVDASDGRVAMVTWMGGDLPDEVPTDAPFRDYADRLAPRLASFSQDLRQEIDHSPAARNRVDGPNGTRVGPAVTVIGHSYGGAVIGTSEQYGLDADSIIHVESAGAGHDVAELDDLRPGRCDARRYSITAARDPIRLSQGVQVPTEGLWSVLIPGDVKDATKDLGHGADAGALYRVERLAGDRGADGRLLAPWAAHSGVLDVGAEGWRNIHRVLNGVPPVRHGQPGADPHTLVPRMH